VQEHEEVTASKLHLVDLAGSERVEKSGSTGDAFVEATHINRSLTYLQQVVMALAEQAKQTKTTGGAVAKGRGSESRGVHIPYRRSRLTAFLRDSLGGNCRTRLVACIWPDPSYAAESANTLRFASRMLLVKNRPVRNITLDGSPAGGHSRIGSRAEDVARIRKLEDEVRMLKEELRLHDEISGRSDIRHSRPNQADIDRVAAVVNALQSSAKQLPSAPQVPIHGAVLPRKLQDPASAIGHWESNPDNPVWELRTVRQLHIALSLLLGRSSLPPHHHGETTGGNPRVAIAKDSSLTTSASDAHDSGGS